MRQVLADKLIMGPVAIQSSMPVRDRVVLLVRLADRTLPLRGNVGSNPTLKQKYAIMKAYTNKSDRIDDRKCLYSSIRHDDKARKSAIRFKIKLELKTKIC